MENVNFAILTDHSKSNVSAKKLLIAVRNVSKKINNIMNKNVKGEVKKKMNSSKHKQKIATWDLQGYKIWEILAS